MRELKLMKPNQFNNKNKKTLNLMFNSKYSKK